MQKLNKMEGRMHLMLSPDNSIRPHLSASISYCRVEIVDAVVKKEVIRLAQFQWHPSINRLVYHQAS